MSEQYIDYFNLDPSYYPEINEDSIRANPDCWKSTYPHRDFIELLKKAHNAMARGLSNQCKSLWLEGAYGTGKSRIAYTLKRLLEAPIADVEEYFDRFQSLKQQPDLLLKYKNQKAAGPVVCAYRYGSGNLQNSNDLCRAAYDSLTQALKARGFDPLAEKTLRGAMLQWLQVPRNQRYMADLIADEEYSYKGSFSEGIEGVMARLRDENRDCNELIRDLQEIAQNQGITGMDLNLDNLKAWIREVIEKNQLKAFFFVWDEFSSFFKQNATHLDQFQKLVELSNEQPFYLIIVTHQTRALLGNDPTSRLIKDRFIFQEITMPDNIAFDLCADALKIQPAAESAWNEVAQDLMNRTITVRGLVAADIYKDDKQKGESVLRRLIPLQPMTALVLKYIAEHFGSNQRSMFNFIRNKDENIHAFQRFIKEKSPYDDEPLLCVDYLWEFLFEQGVGAQGHLDQAASQALYFYNTWADSLFEPEQRLLKTILLLDTLNKQLGSAKAFFHPTDQNLRLCYEGSDLLGEGRATLAANDLCARNILYKRKFNKGEEEYVPLFSDNAAQSEIQKYEETLRKTLKTERLLKEAEIADSKGILILPLTPAQRLRCAFAFGTEDSFAVAQRAVVKDLKEYQFPVLFLFARNAREKDYLQAKIREIYAEGSRYKSVITVDATENLLSEERSNTYIEATAHYDYLVGKQQASKTEIEHFDRQRKDPLKDWREEMRDHGQFRVRSSENIEGLLSNGINAVQQALERMTKKRYPLALDSQQGLSEQFFKASNLKDGALLGLTPIRDGKIAYKGIYQARAVEALLGRFALSEDYLKDENLKNEEIPCLRQAIEQKIRQGFKHSGSVALSDLARLLIKNGLMPSNLMAITMGFLLRDYSGAPYRHACLEQSEQMTCELLAQSIAEAIKFVDGSVPKYQERSIQELTPRQRKFIEFARAVFRTSDDGSLQKQIEEIRNRLLEFGLPIWCLESEADEDARQILDAVQKIGRHEDHSSQIERIGEILEQKPEELTAISALLQKDKLEASMLDYLKRFDNGLLYDLSTRAKTDVLEDFHKVFNGNDGLWMWNRETCEEQIQKLETDYKLILKSAELLGLEIHSFRETVDQWKNKLKFLHIPQKLYEKYDGDLKPICLRFKEICQKDDLNSQNRTVFLSLLEEKAPQLKELFLTDEGQKAVLKGEYGALLKDLSNQDVDEIYAELPRGFTQDYNVFDERLTELCEKQRQNQQKADLLRLWNQLTESPTPSEWSEKNRLPALAVFDASQKNEAESLFHAIESPSASTSEVKSALSFAEKMQSELSSMGHLSQSENDRLFRKRVLRDYEATLKGDLESVRQRLQSIHPKDWLNEAAQNIVKQTADMMYEKKGKEKLADLLSRKSGEQLKSLLLKAVDDDTTLGRALLIYLENAE